MTNNPNCTDFCTAAKCEELEARIGKLEQDLVLLKASFEAHIIQEIPDAHSYYPTVNVESDISDGTLIIDVTVNDSNDSAMVELPEPTVNVEADISDGTLIVDVTVNDSNDSAMVELPEPTVNVEANISDGTLIIDVAVGDNRDLATVELSEPTVNVEADISDGTLIVDVTVNDSNDSAMVELPEPTVNVGANINDGTLIVDVTVNDSNDSAMVELPEPTVNVGANINDGTLIIYVAVGDSNDLATVKIDMNCDDISNELRNLQNILIAKIEDSKNNIFNKIDDLKNELTGDLSDIKNYVTVDISGIASTDYQCKFVYDDNDNLIPGYAESNFTEIEYSGVGLIGIHENLKLVNANLDKLHSDVCKAVDPISTLTIDDLYKYCLSNEIDRSNYKSGDEGQEKYEEAAREYLYNLLIDSKYGYLVENIIDDKLITAPNNWITPMLANFGLIQSKINNTAICEIEEVEPNDVVSIVASEAVIPKAEGKVLILHFVELNNYPKRSRNSSYWQIQIPAARESYEWDADFESLRWRRGNQYAELRFEEFKNPVSGFFEDESAANAYFDAVLNLTTATEKNRVIPKHSNPKNNVTQRETRPYRAFIESVNQQGKPICHLKYIPPKGESND